MSVIKYTAKRNIEPLDTGFSVTATDISAVASDDSFNASSTDLSGVSAGDYINVSGFDLSDNNGWHQVASATSTKITTNSALSDEGAGNSVTITGYKRGYGEEYSLYPKFRSAETSHETDRMQTVTIGGKVDTQFFHKARIVNISTGYIAESETRQYDEFLDSVSGGETFTIDIHGDASGSDNEQSVTLEDDPREKRFEFSKEKMYSFKVRLL